MILQTILEGLGLGALLVLVCAVGIRKGAVGMVHLYSHEVQDRCVKLGLTTHAKIKRNALIFKAVCVPGYIAYVLVCVYGINGARGFAAGFWQLLVILSVMNLIDRFLIDGYWVGHTSAWEIPGTEDLKPYITAKDKGKKWLFGTVGMAVVAAVLAALTLATDKALALKLYPVLVNLCWLAFFAASLFSTPAVELFARMKYPLLPVGAQRYCRLATRAWCVFFIANAAVALDSALFRSDAWWALYNGAIAYGAIALMFAGEYIARRLYARRHGLPL